MQASRTFIETYVVMDSKLILSIKPDVIAKGKVWARKRGKSLSGLIEEFLEKSFERETEEADTLELIKELAKGIRPLSDAEYAQRKHDHIMRKYGGR